MRIVKGKLAGRHLTSPKQGRVRPTSETVRDAWLSALEPRLKGARVLDLFAGTGALGLEALSRGARYADFVESGSDSLHALKSNVTALRVRDKARIFKKDALPFAAALPARAYDIAFADPPYESRMLDRLIETWMDNPFASLLAVEHAAGHELPPGGKRRQMDETTAVTFYLAPPAPPEQPAPVDGDAAVEDAAG